MKQLMIFSIALLAALPAAAQPAAGESAAPGDPWTLQQCIDFAQTHSTTVGERAVQVEQGENQLSASRAGRLPSVNASVGYNASFGRSPGEDNTYKTQTMQTGSFDVSASMPLFQAFRHQRTVKGNRLDLAAAVQDLERAREDVAVNVMTLYLQVLYNKELVRVAEQQLALSSQQAERSRSLVEQGRQPESARYESEALVANDRLALTQSRNDLQLALLDLSQALNRESAFGFDVVRPELDRLLQEALDTRMESADAVYDTAAANRPHIRAERIRLESSRNSVAVARSDLYPSFSLRGGYGTGIYSSMPDGFWPQFRHNGSEYIGVSMSVPIFNGHRARSAVRSAQIAVRRQELALTEAERALRKQIEQAWYTARAAADKYRSSEAALVSARTAFAYAEEKAAAGRATIFDFNDAKTRMEKAESDLVQAKYELVFRRKILDYYRGMPLTL